MKPHITISIQSSNSFFSMGMKYILKEYFSTQRCSFCFVPLTPKAITDLMIFIAPTICQTQIDRLLDKQRDSRIGTIIVQNEAVKTESANMGKSSTLNQKTRPDTVIDLVHKMFHQAHLKPVTAHKAYINHHQGLTLRQQEILEEISRELTPGQIAKKLSLNVKTISAHKQTAMRKLGFRRNRELYRWLQQGGLEW